MRERITRACETVFLLMAYLGMYKWEVAYSALASQNTFHKQSQNCPAKQYLSTLLTDSEQIVLYEVQFLID